MSPYVLSLAIYLLLFTTKVTLQVDKKELLWEGHVFETAHTQHQQPNGNLEEYVLRIQSNLVSKKQRRVEIIPTDSIARAQDIGITILVAPRRCFGWIKLGHLPKPSFTYNIAQYPSPSHSHSSRGLQHRQISKTGGKSWLSVISRSLADSPLSNKRLLMAQWLLASLQPNKNPGSNPANSSF